MEGWNEVAGCILRLYSAPLCEFFIGNIDRRERILCVSVHLYVPLVDSRATGDISAKLWVTCSECYLCGCWISVSTLGLVHVDWKLGDSVIFLRIRRCPETRAERLSLSDLKKRVCSD